VTIPQFVGGGLVTGLEPAQPGRHGRSRVQERLRAARKRRALPITCRDGITAAAPRQSASGSGAAREAGEGAGSATGNKDRCCNESGASGGPAGCPCLSVLRPLLVPGGVR